MIAFALLGLLAGCFAARESAYADIRITYTLMPLSYTTTYQAESGFGALEITAEADEGEVAYTWYKRGDGEPEAVGTGDRFVFTKVSDTGTYFCRVSVYDEEEDEYYYEDTRDCEVTVYPNTRMKVIGPTEGEAYPGDIVLNATALTGDDTELSYTWYKDGGTDPIGTGPTYTVYENADYACTITGNLGGVLAWSTTLNAPEVNVTTPTPTRIEGGSVDYGGSVTLDATMDPADGNTYSYAWYRSGTDEPVGDRATLFIDKPSQSGLYKCRVFCELSNGYVWSDYTNEVTVTIYKIRLELSIDDKTAEYGDEDLPLTYTRLTALVGGDTDEEIEEAVTLTREEGKDAGTYRITGTCDSDVYAVHFIDGTYTVKAREIIVRIMPETVRYGDEEKSLSYRVEGSLAAGDEESDLAITLSRRAGKDAGRYAIAGTYDNDNYNLTFLPAVYTILPKQVQVNLIGCSDLVYDGTTPKITCELIAPPENVALNPTITFDKAVKNAGDYVAYIRFSDQNYVPYITEYPFSVAKAPLVIGLDKTIVVQYGQLTPRYLYRGFIGKDDESVLTELPSVNVNTSRVGVFEVTPSGAAAQNYDITYLSGTVQVDYAGAEEEYGAVTGAFSPEESVEVAEGGEATVGGLSLKVFTFTVSGVADGTYTTQVYSVQKYPNIFLRAAIVDDQGVRHEVKNFSLDEEGTLTYSSDTTGVFVLYYDLVVPVVVVALLIVIVVILLLVRAKDNRKNRKFRERQYIARQYVNDVVPRQTEDEDEY